MPMGAVCLLKTSRAESCGHENLPGLHIGIALHKQGVSLLIVELLRSKHNDGIESLFIDQ
jgi:hypothetical protein